MFFALGQRLAKYPSRRLKRFLIRYVEIRPKCGGLVVLVDGLYLFGHAGPLPPTPTEGPGRGAGESRESAILNIREYARPMGAHQFAARWQSKISPLSFTPWGFPWAHDRDVSIRAQLWRRLSGKVFS